MKAKRSCSLFLTCFLSLNVYGRPGALNFWKTNKDPSLNNLYSFCDCKYFAPSEVSALMELKSKMQDGNTDVFSNWSKKRTCTEGWSGVACDKRGRVTVIKLRNKGLQGTISPILGNFKKLQYLDLSNNKLRGNLPLTLGRLLNVVELNLAYNELTGPIPHYSGNLTKLHGFFMNHNYLSGGVGLDLPNFCAPWVSSDFSFNCLNTNYSAESSEGNFYQTCLVREVQRSREDCSLHRSSQMVNFF